jgi:hypothetical protein
VKRLAPHIFGAEIPGGNYTAEEISVNGVKFFKIRRVPIFCAVPKGERGNKKDIGREWMLAALERAKDRETKDRYLAPLHFHHHSWGDKAQAAGFMRLTEVGTIEYEGKPIDATFADLLVPGDKFGMIETFQFPYRSVEVFDWEAPEINSLALLDHEVPFFRLELLTIGEKVAQSNARELVFEAYRAMPIKNVVYAGKGGVATFSLKGAKLAAPPVVDDEKKKKPAAEGDTEDAVKGDEDDGQPMPCPTCKGEGFDGEEKLCPTCKGEGETTGTGDDADQDTEALGDDDMKALLTRIAEGQDAILAALGNLGKAPTDPAAPPAEPKEDPAAAKMGAELKGALKGMAEMAAEARAAQKEIAAFRADQAADTLVQEKLDGELKGKNLDKDDLTQLKKFAKLGKEYLNSFSAVLAKRLPDDPHGIDDDANGSTPPGTPSAGELMHVECLKKYAHDPNLFAQAQVFYKEALAMQKKGFDRDPARHVDVQMRFAAKEIGAGRTF